MRLNARFMAGSRGVVRRVAGGAGVGRVGGLCVRCGVTGGECGEWLAFIATVTQ